MKLIRNLFLAFLVPLFAGALMVANAAEPAIEKAKTDGIVGEMYTGYLGYVNEGKASADLKRRVEENNAKRLSVYTNLAKQQGVSLDVVAALTAEKQINNETAGRFVMAGAGSGWQQK